MTKIFILVLVCLFLLSLAPILIKVSTPIKRNIPFLSGLRCHHISIQKTEGGRFTRQGDDFGFESNSDWLKLLITTPSDLWQKHLFTMNKRKIHFIKLMWKKNANKIPTSIFVCEKWKISFLRNNFLHTLFHR